VADVDDVRSRKEEYEVLAVLCNGYYGGQTASADFHASRAKGEREEVTGGTVAIEQGRGE
jgi:hypothetical protein